MQVNYPKILYLLQLCTSTNVNQAENQLKQLAICNPTQTMQYIKQSILDKSLQQNTHIIGCTILSQIFIQNIKNYTDQYIYNYWTSILLEPGITIKKKQLFKNMIITILQYFQPQYLIKWKQFSQNLLVSQSCFEIGLQMINMYTCVDIEYGNMLESMDQKGFTFMMAIVMRKFMSFINNDDQKNKDKYQAIVNIMQSWVNVVQYLREKSKKNNKFYQIFYGIGNCKQFVDVLRYILEQLSSGQGKHFLYLQYNPFLPSIQHLKKLTLQLHHNILQLLLKKQTKYFQTLLHQYACNNIQKYINSLTLITTIPSYTQQYNIQQILIYIIKILKNIIKYQPAILQNIWKQLLYYLIFPLMRTNQQEMQDFQQNTQCYVEVSQDVCERQKLGILKSQVANFMEIIADRSMIVQRFMQKNMGKSRKTQQIISNIHIDSDRKRQQLIPKYILNFCIASIKHNLQLQRITSIPHNNNNIINLNTQTSFLILTIFSYCLQYYSQQLQQIRYILTSQKIYTLYPIQKARIYTFLSYNYNQIYPYTKPQSQQYLNNWISTAVHQHIHPTVNYCALDFISNTLHKFYNQSIIKCLIQRIVYVTQLNFWQIIKKIIQLYLHKISQQILLQLIKQCYKRIDIQIQNQMNHQIKLTYIISYILNILQIISSQGQYLNNNVYNVKLLLWDITKLYPISKQLYFNDLIINIISNYLYYANKDEIQCQQMNKYLQEFIGEFRECQYQHVYYYITFNQYAYKGKYQNTAKIIYQVLKQSLQYFLGQQNNSKAQKKQNKKNKLSIANTLLVIQHILIWHGQKLSLQQHTYLYSTMKKLYPKHVPHKTSPTKTQIIIYDRILLARALIIQLICHTYLGNTNIIEYLKKYNHLNIFYGYDVSVMIQCIQLQLFRQKQLGNLVDLVEIWVRIGYGCVLANVQFGKDKYKQKYMQDNKLKYMQDNKIITTDINQQNIIQQQINPQLQKKKIKLKNHIKTLSVYQKILKHIHTPFKYIKDKEAKQQKQTKYIKNIKQQFRQLLKQLQEYNQELFISILQGFSDDVKNKIEVILQCKIQEIIKRNTNQQGHFNERRRIFKVKGIKNQIIQEEFEQQVLDQQDFKRKQMILNQQDQIQNYQEDHEDIKIRKAQKKRIQKRKQKQFNQH